MAKNESSEAADHAERRQKLLSFPDTDAGNGEAFQFLHGGSFRYDHTRGRWLFWNGLFWALDETGEAERAALETVRARQSAAFWIEDVNEKAKRMHWAVSSESVWRRRALLESAKSHPSLATKTEDYDVDTFLLTVGNGTLDPRFGELRPARPEDYITRATDVPYDPAATAPRWLRFLDEIFAGDAELVEFVRRSLGYALVGDVREQCLFIVYGTGANGETTFLEILLKLVGTHGITAPFSAFVVQRNEGNPRNDLAALHGARLVKASEVGHRATFDEAVIKLLTGGDTISARFLYREPFQFKPQFKIWLATNRKPAIRDTDEAIWRRIRLITLTRQFEGANRDPKLLEQLVGELPGILAWTVQGCQAWWKHGLGEPPRVREATRKYREESDQTARFLSDRCILGPELQTPGKQFMDAFQDWCAENGEKPDMKNFTNNLARHGITKTRDRSGVTYQGVALESTAATRPSVPLWPKKRGQ